jgi:hypothetical protein
MQHNISTILQNMIKKKIIIKVERQFHEKVTIY